MLVPSESLHNNSAYLYLCCCIYIVTFLAIRVLKNEYITNVVLLFIHT